MKAEQILERYTFEHPDYWEYNDELEEVARLRSLCEKEIIN